MKANKFLSFLILFLVFQGCSKAKDGTDTIVITNPPVDEVIAKATYDLSLLEKCTLFTDYAAVTNLQRQDYMELSGLACSHSNPGILYVHQDSGNGNEVFITNAKGEDLGKIILDGISNRDWEDIACGPGPDSSKNYIYVAEIGDNDASYSGISIYRFAEPDLLGAASQTLKHVSHDILQFIYPKGPVNAETLLLDPATKDLYIATKESSKSTLFVARYPQSVTSVTTLKPLATFPFDLLTAGDISPDGSEIVIRNTGQIWYWKRLANETVVDAMLRQPQDAPYVRNEHQGESIGFSADGTGYYTTSETKKFSADKSALSFYKRK